MNYLKWIVAPTLVLSAALAAHPLQAQFRYSRPQTNPFGGAGFSPYLNLGRGGNPAINYYGIVRPQLQTYQSLQHLQQQSAYSQQTADPRGGQLFLGSGHPTYFFNYSHYYPAMRNIPLGGLPITTGR